MKTGKAIARQGFKTIERSFRNTEGHWLDKHKSWLAEELRSLTVRLCGTGATAGGEGVSDAATPRITNQSLPSGNFPQCAPTEQSAEPAGVQQPESITVTAGGPSVAAWFKPEGGSTTAADANETYRVGLSFPVVSGGTGSETRAAVYVAALTEAPPRATSEPESAALWPREADVKVVGYVLNQRLMEGAVVGADGRVGRKCSIWKGRNRLVVGAVLRCRLDLVQGDDARYLPLGVAS